MGDAEEYETGNNRLLALGAGRFAQPMMAPPPDRYPPGIGSDQATSGRATNDYYRPLVEMIVGMHNARIESEQAGKRAAQLPSSFKPGERMSDDFIRRGPGYLDSFQGGHWRDLWKHAGKERMSLPADTDYDFLPGP